MDKEIKVNSRNLKATIGDIEYHWYGGCGSVIISYENNIKPGDLRQIGNIIFYAMYVHKRFWVKNEVCWVPSNDFDTKWINDFKYKLFG